MKLIIISPPHYFKGEAEAVNALMARAQFTLHLRKPNTETNALRTLINAIEPCYHSRLVLHDGFELSGEFSLQGLHLNRRNSLAPQHFKGTISCSCHSWEEVEAYSTLVDYLFISPLFDSLSKANYHQAFTHKELLEAQRRGLINTKVVGLSGITPDQLQYLYSLGFGGVAVIGSIWGDYSESGDLPQLIERLNLWNKEIKRYGI